MGGAGFHLRLYYGDGDGAGIPWHMPTIGALPGGSKQTDIHGNFFKECVSVGLLCVWFELHGNFFGIWYLWAVSWKVFFFVK